MNDSIIGLDAVVLTVTGTFLKQIEQRVVRRNKQGRLYLEVNRTKQNDSYNVTIILPSIIRPSNLQGFSIFDSIKLEYLIEVIKEDLQDIIGTTNLNNLVVKQVEINANKHVSHKVDVDMITAFFARALLKTDAQLIEHCHGKNIKQARTIKTKIIDGFKTERNTSKRFYTKVYNKTRQLGIEDKKKCSVFRLEQIYTSLGVSQALGKKEK